ncbi:MAG TPA: ABC transporter ATP-binding protein, partial [Bacilli bacterium]|nr:ABC transporter ATP-binding protein [Bacilli bacterium]
MKKRSNSLFSLLKGHFPLLIVALLLVVFHRVTYSFVPLFTQYLLKYLQNIGGTVTDVNLPGFVLTFLNSAETALQAVIFIALSLLTWQVTRFTLMIGERTIQARLQEQIALELRVKLFDHIQSLPYHYLNNSDTGDLIQRVTSDVETTTGFIVVRFMDAFGLVFTLLSGAYQMYFLSPLLMYIALATIPIYAVSSILYFGRVRKRYREIEEKEAEMITVIQENVNNIKIVKAFANENFEISKLDEKNLAHTTERIKTNKVVGLYWGMMDFLALSQYLVITLVGIYLSLNGHLNAPDVAAALMLIGLLIWPVRGLGRLINDFSMANVAMTRINEILAEQSEFTVNGKEKPAINGEIIFKDVSFKFPDAEDYALRKLNFTIKKGQTVAFIGRTGSGKTTIMNLLMRMYEYEGSILVDGVELREIEKHHLRKNIGAVLQNPFLYSKTIRENISITSKSIPFALIEDASEIATINADIRSFSKGYDTMVGERGTTLSGGQKQRVAIARVLVSDKPILIFDDALSAVDNKTDALIRSA